MKNKKTIAFELRMLGKSYTEIVKETGISKSTLSYWFSKTLWSRKVTAQINEEQKQKIHQLVATMNSKRKELMEKRYEKYRHEARVTFEKLKGNPLFLTGLSLYWGEGSKTHNGRVSVVNTDLEMIKVMLVFYKKILKVPEEKIRVELFIYNDLDKDKVKQYWSSQLKIDEKNFIKIQVLPSKNKKVKKKTINGICALYFSNTEFSIRILEWIKLLATEMRE